MPQGRMPGRRSSTGRTIVDKSWNAATVYKLTMQTRFTLSSLLAPATAATAALVLTACFTGPQAPAVAGTAAVNAPNRYGYGGTVTDPSNMLRQPSPGPDGILAQAIAPQASANTIVQATGQQPAAGLNPVVTTPLLPTGSDSPRTPPNTGLNPTAPPPPTPPATAAATTPPPPPTPPAPPPTQKKDDYPYGIPVPGKEGLVYSPYDQKAGYVDVRGLKPGSLVEDPYSKKYFRVP
jgi:hypothetical protein